MREALHKAAALTVFAVLPLLIIAGGLRLGLQDNSLAWDFHHELYPQASEMLDGDNPYPPTEFEPLEGNNKVWPPAAVALAAPLTLVSPLTADLMIAVAGLACFGLALWLVGVRDWRVYGVAALWPPVFIESGLSHLTPVLVLLAALAWRARAARFRSGVYVGFAIALKFLLWPLCIWLAARERRGAALLAVALSAASFLLVLPYIGLVGYGQALRRVGNAYDQDTYTVFGLVSQAGGSEAIARGLTLVLVVVLAWGTWRYRSFTLAIACALVASPIVWLDFYALALVPLAIARPRLSPVWFVPLATVGLEGAGWQIGDTLGTLRVLISFSIVLAVAYAVEQGRPVRLPSSLVAERVHWPRGNP